MSKSRTVEHRKGRHIARIRAPAGLSFPRRGVCRWWLAYRPAKGGPVMAPAP